jgi:hypothetical protein
MEKSGMKKYIPGRNGRSSENGNELSLSAYGNGMN